MDSIALSPTSSGSMKLETPANVMIAYVFVYESSQSPNPVLHVLRLTEPGEFSLINQVRDGLANICGADYVQELHISNANCNGDNHLCGNVFIAINSGHTVSFPLTGTTCQCSEESFTDRYYEAVAPFRDSYELMVKFKDDASGLKIFCSELMEVPDADLVSFQPNKYYSCESDDEIDEMVCPSIPRSNPLLVRGAQLESYSTLDDSTAAKSLLNEICVIPEQTLDHHVPQPGMPSGPQTLESNYNPFMDACREGDSYIIEVLFHGYPMDAELDTGSPYTIISKECLTSILKSTPEDWSARLEQRMEPSTIEELKAYNGEVINVREQIDVIITRGELKVNAKVLIHEGAPVPLLIGKDVLPQLGYKLMERVSDSADECQHYQVVRPVPTGPDKVKRYLGRCPKFLNACNVNDEAGLCSIACKSKLPMPTKEPLLQSDEIIIDMTLCFD